MRQQLGYLFLFRQAVEAADVWRGQFADEKIMESTRLAQFEFLMAARFKPAQKFLLTK